MGSNIYNRVCGWLNGNRSGGILLILCISLAILIAAGCFFHFDCLGKAALVKLVTATAVFAMFALFPKLFFCKAADLLCFVLLLWTLYETILGMLQLYGFVRTNGIGFPITGSFDNPNPFAVFLAISVCVLIAWGRDVKCSILRVSAYTAVLLCVMVLPSTRCRAALSGLVAGLICVFPSARRQLVSKPWLVVSLGVLFSVGLYFWKKPSADGRMQLWRLSISAMSDGKAGGLLGHGPGHFAKAAATVQADFFKSRIVFDGQVPEISEKVQKQCHKAQPMLFAYNDLLQIGVEMGYLGMSLLLLINLFAIGCLVARGSPLTGGFVALSVSGLFMYTLCLWQFYILYAAFVGVAVSGICMERISSIPSAIRLVSVLSLVLLFLPYTLKHEINRKDWRIETCLLSQGCNSAFIRCEQPRLRYLADNMVFMSEFAYALAQSGNLERSDSIACIGYDSWGNPGFMLQLGDNSYARGDYSKAREYYRETFLALPDRITPLARMAQCYLAQNDTAGLEAMKCFLKSFHAHVESAETENLRKEVFMME